MINCSKKLLALAVAAAPLWSAGPALAQQAQSESGNSSRRIEEVTVVARLKSSAENVIMQRMEHEAITDMMSAEMIGRIGDSNVATALRRVTGVSLVDDKFVYVRGLGERYSSSLLNGAHVPSPDLTRNVLPLDIFPTSIIETLAVQKTYSADMPAGFGGGNVDIRTKGIPDGFVFDVEVGSTYNFEQSGNGLTYDGGGDDWWGTDDGTRALPGELRGAFNEYQGNISSRNIFNRLRQQDPGVTFADAQALNRQLATTLFRDLSIEDGDKPGENFDGQVNLGHRFYFDNGVEFGFLAGGSYEHEFETRETVTRTWTDPDDQFDRETRSTRTVDITGNLNLGLRLNGEQSISTTSLYLRNTDDVAAITNSHPLNRPLSSGLGFREYDIRYDERDLEVHQIKGSHVWGEETRDLVGLDWIHETLPFLDQLQLDWYYSDATVNTEVPSEVNVRGDIQVDPATGEVLNSNVRQSDSIASYRFTDLEDEVLSHGWKLSWPVFIGDFDIELAGGYDYVRKNRTYRQTDLLLGSTSSALVPELTQPLSDIFADDNILDSELGFNLSVSPATARSYLAATTNEASFLKADITWRDTWRLIAGARYEEYIQVGLPWNPLEFGAGGQISMDPATLREAVFMDDDIFPSLSLVYMTSDFWAETFQLRFGYSETVVRPDLREIADTSYRDPLDNALVFGNPELVPASIDNYDLRAEWFFNNGDSLTASLFYKEIADPIEFFERPAAETKAAREVINAESAEMQGVELEFLKELAFLGGPFQPFFMAGNLTWLDHELEAGDRADSPTNPTRGLAGASDYVANLQLGFDSDNGQHSATLVYNVFGERLRTAGRLGAPDIFEQPFHSLDLTYFFYPNDNLTVKAKVKNLLDETVTLERNDVETWEEEVGLSASLAVEWAF